MPHSFAGPSSASFTGSFEDNWDLGGLGDQSFDAIAGTILDLFDFARPRPTPLILSPETGAPTP